MFKVIHFGSLRSYFTVSLFIKVLYNICSVPTQVAKFTPITDVFLTQVQDYFIAQGKLVAAVYYIRSKIKER